MRSIKILENASDVIVLQFVVHVGSIYEEPRLYGISHLLEHMMFQTKKHKASIKLLKELQEAGTLYNASTSYDMTMYYMIGHTHVWKQVVDLFWTLTFDAIDFTDAELANEVNVVLEELSMRDGMSGGPEDVITKLLWKNTAYEHEIGGYKDTLKSITRQDLLDYHGKFYENSHFFANVPSHQRKEVEDYIMSKFGDKLALSTCPPVSPPPLYDILKIKGGDNMLAIIPDANLPATTVAVFFRSFPFDVNKIVMVDLLTHALTGLAGILTLQMREHNGFTYNVGASNMSFVDHGCYSISFQTTHKDINRVMRTFFDSLLNLAQKGFTRKAFDGLKRSFLLTQKTELRDPFDLTYKLMHYKFYSDIDLDGLDAYIETVDKLLDHDAFSAFLKDFLKMASGILFLSTFETDKVVLEKITKGYKDFIKAVSS